MSFSLELGVESVIQDYGRGVIHISLCCSCLEGVAQTVCAVCRQAGLTLLLEMGYYNLFQRASTHFRFICTVSVGPWKGWFTQCAVCLTFDRMLQSAVWMFWSFYGIWVKQILSLLQPWLVSLSQKKHLPGKGRMLVAETQWGRLCNARERASIVGRTQGYVIDDPCV